MDKSAQDGSLHRMLSGDIRSKVDALWNAFWSCGIANPIEVIEQITYLFFLKRLDDLETLEAEIQQGMKELEGMRR